MPREWATAIAAAHIPFVVENTGTNVSDSHRRRRSVAPSAPEIDHLLAVAVDGDCRPDLSPAPEVRPERVSHPHRSPRRHRPRSTRHQTTASVRLPGSGGAPRKLPTTTDPPALAHLDRANCRQPQFPATRMERQPRGRTRAATPRSESLEVLRRCCSLRMAPRPNRVLGPEVVAYRPGPPTEEACWPARRRVPAPRTRPSSRPHRYAAVRQGERRARLPNVTVYPPDRWTGTSTRTNEPTSRTDISTSLPHVLAARSSSGTERDRLRKDESQMPIVFVRGKPAYPLTSHGSPMQPARALVGCPPPERQLLGTDLQGRAESAAIVRHVNATYSAEGDSLSASGPTSHDHSSSGASSTNATKRLSDSSSASLTLSSRYPSSAMPHSSAAGTRYRTSSGTASGRSRMRSDCPAGRRIDKQAGAPNQHLVNSCVRTT